MLRSHKQNLVFLLKMEFPLILVARQRTSHVLFLLSLSLLQNIVNTLFDTIGEIKGYYTVLDLK